MSTITPEQQQQPRGWLGTRWLRFALALTFLTRLPLPIRGEVRSEDMRASIGWYPLIGAGLGAAGWGGYLACQWAFGNALLAAALVIILLEYATGALHLDGFMDTCDGLGSGKPREGALEIMKDSRVGAMGVFGGVAIILVKVAALAALPETRVLLPLLVGWGAARMTAVVGITGFRYARATGTGGLFTGGRSYAAFGFALVTLLALAWQVGHLWGLALAGAVLAITWLAQAVIARKLGGLTGDVYGLGIELGEALALLLACGLAKWNCY